MSNRTTGKLLTGMRGYLTDFHRNDLPEIHFGGFDAGHYRERLRESNLDHVMIYAKDHWGWAYYPTRIGEMHPKAAQAGPDLLRMMKEAAEAEGLGACLYYSVDTDHRAARRHPEWGAQDAWGDPVDAGGRWLRCCIGHGYRAYALGQLREILEDYRPQGLFLDCFPSVFCFCPLCRKRYHEITGSVMPLGDEANAQWRTLLRYEEEHYWLPFLSALHRLRDEVSPDTLLTGNGCNANLPASLRELYDYHFAEPWAGNYLSAGFVRDVMRSPQIGPGNIGTVYDSTPPEAVARELLSIGMQGVRPFLYSESMDQEGRLIPHEWDRIAAAFGQVAEVESLWQAEPAADDVLILYSERSHRFDPECNRFQPLWWERGSTHLTAMQTAMGLAASLQLGYSIVPEAPEGGLPADLQAAAAAGRLLVLPNARVLHAQTWAELAAYAQSGGRILAVFSGAPADETGAESCPPEALALFGCRRLLTDKRFAVNGISAYVEWLAEAGVPAALQGKPLAAVGSRLLVEPDGAVPLAQFIAPVFEEDLAQERWMAWRPPNPGHERLGPAAVRHSYGRGEVVLAGLDLFAMANSGMSLLTGLAAASREGWHWPGVWLKSELEKGSPCRIRFLGLEAGFRVSYFREGTVLYVHLLNLTDLPLAAGHGRLELTAVSPDGEPAGSEVYPRQQKLKLEAFPERAAVVLPELGLYTVISIEHPG